jgi:very-short-patch-repair endonuclease
VATSADGRAANPFESVLRALCIEEGFELTPQLQIADSGLYAIVDLGSEELRLAVEADGFEHHGTRKGLRRDCRRHTELAVFDWSSLRFSFEDVMAEQAWVRWALRSWRLVRAGGVPEDPPLRSR